jgi:hypothetical protein
VLFAPILRQVTALYVRKEQCQQEIPKRFGIKQGGPVREGPRLPDKALQSTDADSKNTLDNVF